MSQHLRLAVRPSVVQKRPGPLGDVLDDIQPVFDLARARLFVVDTSLQPPAGESIGGPDEGRTIIHRDAFLPVNLAQALLDVTSWIYDWLADAPDAPSARRHTLLVALRADPGAPESRLGFLVLQGRREVIQIAERCLDLCPGRRPVASTASS